MKTPHPFSFHGINKLLLMGLLYLIITNNANTQCLGSIELNVVAAPEPEIEGDTSLCVGGSTELTVEGGPFTSVQWSNGSSDESITITEAGNYAVEVTNAAECITEVAQEVVLLEEVDAEIQELSYDCDGEISLDAGSDYSEFLWSTGDTDQIITVSEEAIYTVTVTSTEGCTGIASYAVEIPEDPIVNLSGALIFCEGSSTEIQATAGFEAYLWSDGSVTETISVSNAGIISVTVTDALGCTSEASETIIKNPFTQPVISGPADICPGDVVTLEVEGDNYAEYLWSNGEITPAVEVATSGIYSVTVTAINGCTGTASQLINLLPLPSPVISGNDILCEGNSTFLSVSNTFSSFEWSTGSEDSFIEVNSIGDYSVTVTNAEGCSNEASITITEGTPPDVLIDLFDTELCANSAPFFLTADPVGGNWSGDVDASGFLDPLSLGEGAFTVFYAYEDQNGCIGVDEVDFSILPLTEISIQSELEYCISDGFQQLEATPAEGVWGGIVNEDGQFDASSLTPGSYAVTFTAQSTGSCLNTEEIFIDILDPPTASIDGGGVFCNDGGQDVAITFTSIGNGPFEVTYTIDDTSPSMLTLPEGSTSLNVLEPGVYAITSITDVNGCIGTGNGSVSISFVDAPQVNNVTFDCDDSQSVYTVSFEISGGDPISYLIDTDLADGSLTTTAPYVYTSASIPSGSPYSFTVNDANNCNPVSFNGSFNCDCATNSGSMDLNAIELCAGESVIGMHFEDQTLDANDTLLFVLHDGSGNTLGQINQINSIPEFDFSDTFELG